MIFISARDVLGPSFVDFIDQRDQRKIDSTFERYLRVRSINRLRSRLFFSVSSDRYL
jgi:hypothetical protein